MRQSKIRLADAAHELLAGSAEFRRYRLAFEQTLGLTIHLLPARDVSMGQTTGASDRTESERTPPSFCVLMARLSPNCLACLEEERRVISKIGRDPVSFDCFPGLRRAAVPIWSSETLIGLLQTGPLLAEAPTAQSTGRVGRQALRRGVAEGNVEELLRAYESTPVLSFDRQRATIQLLTLFAEHLAAFAQRTLDHELANVELPAIDKARRIIEAEFAGDLTLTKVARAVGLSARHFSEVFHQTTGETFTGYLARLRIERAKSLLAYRYLGVGEIAYKVGFRSLSQFNRTFRRLTGNTPSAHRESLLETAADWPASLNAPPSQKMHKVSDDVHNRTHTQCAN